MVVDRERDSQSYPVYTIQPVVNAVWQPDDNRLYRVNGASDRQLTDRGCCDASTPIMLNRFLYFFKINIINFLHKNELLSHLRTGHCGQ